MAFIPTIDSDDKKEIYEHILKHYEVILQEVDDPIPNFANGASILGMFMQEINWAGFYLMKDGVLKLGPFYGKTAVTTIEIGNGVCGTAAEKKETIIVPDVHQFPGHITCDLLSNSEIVLPIIVDDKLIGVLDIDSPAIDRFDETDQKYLEEFIELLIEHTDFSL